MNIQTNNNVDTSPIPNAASIATAAAASVNSNNSNFKIEEPNLPFYYTPSSSSSSTVSSPMDYDSIMYECQQFPSLDAFNNIIHNYLQKLSSKKRDKALVDSHRYSLILQVLKDPRNTAISTAQFRFWVKKMFRLMTTTDHMEYVCHDDKPVATREDIYHILVLAHKEAHHGGRDKTSALVRKRYSWIPKELIARFVRHCPFCISRRNGCHQPASDITPKSPSIRSNARQRRLNRQQKSTYNKNYYSPASISMVATVATSAAAAAVASSTTWIKPAVELDEHAFDFYYEQQQQQQRQDTSSLDSQNACSPKPNLFTNSNNHTSFSFLLNDNDNNNSTAAVSAVVAAAAMAAVHSSNFQPSSPSSCISTSSDSSPSSISQQEQQQVTSLIETPAQQVDYPSSSPSKTCTANDGMSPNSPDTLLLTRSATNF